MPIPHDPTGGRSATDTLNLALEHFKAGRLLAAETLCQQVLASDPSSSGAFRLHDRICRQLDQAVRNAVAAFQNNPEPVAIGRLRQLRRDTVSFLQLQPGGTFPALWASPLREMYRLLLTSGLRDYPRNPQEDALARRLAEELSTALPEPGHPATLASAMLLCHNYELPVADHLTAVPDWLREHHLDFLLELTEVYNQPGEAETYVDFQIRFIELIHGLGITPTGISEDPAIRHLVHQVAGRVTLAQTYFTERNLRDLLAHRGDVMAAGLLLAGMNPMMAIPPKLAHSGKIRLGIFAMHFGVKTETYFTLSHFDHLDRTRFEIILYAMAEAGQDIERYCISRADRIVTANADAQSSDPIIELVAQMRRDDLDILLISSNMSAISSGTAIAGSCRIAPIQVATVSTPTTTGCRHTDVMLSSEWNEPDADAAEQYNEYLYCMPGSVNYYCFHLDREPASIEVDRDKAKIPPGQIVFFSGAINYKILPELSRLWMDILAAVPDSILILMPFNPNWRAQYRIAPFIERLHRQMIDRGLSLSRLRVINAVPTRADVHRLVALADVYLDAYPFSGACSLLDPIMVGVPTVARRGPMGRSNHAASLLRMVGLEELVTNSEQEYLALAVALANDPDRRRRVREHLLALRAADPPPYFDIPLFSRRVGEALEDVYQRYQTRYRRVAGLPDHLLRDELQALADSVVGKNFELNTLTDTGLIHSLVEPFFRAHRPRDRTPHMIDVGACYGIMSRPFLAAGWTADVFEPDPGARDVLKDKLSAFASQFRVHGVAVCDTAVASVSFHKAATHGLSGLGDSPFGATEDIIEVPASRLADFYSRNGIEAVDFLKIDAEGYDFDVLQSHDLSRVQPRLIMVEYGTRFHRQTVETINQAIARLAESGYGAVVFNYTDDGNFDKGDWRHRLIDIFVDRDIPLDRTSAFGNILFYRKGDRAFLLTLYSLLESCVQPRRAVWEGGQSREL